MTTWIPHRRRVRTLVALLELFLCGCTCRNHHGETEAKPQEDDEGGDEDHEERDGQRAQYWRTQIEIVGKGTVRTNAPTFDCASDGRRQSGACGPALVTFVEREPPLLHATGAPGWRLDHWESRTLERDGRVLARAGRMPDGRNYLNGFGYADTGALETVTAVFAPASDGDDDLAVDAKARHGVF